MAHCASASSSPLEFWGTVVEVLEICSISFSDHPKSLWMQMAAVEFP